MSKEGLEMGMESEEVDPTDERHSGDGSDEGYDFKLTGEALGDETFDDR